MTMLQACSAISVERQQHPTHQVRTRRQQEVIVLAALQNSRTERSLDVHAAAEAAAPGDGCACGVRVL